MVLNFTTIYLNVFIVACICIFFGLLQIPTAMATDTSTTSNSEDPTAESQTDGTVTARLSTGGNSISSTYTSATGSTTAGNNGAMGTVQIQFIVASMSIIGSLLLPHLVARVWTMHFFSFDKNKIRPFCCCCFWLACVCDHSIPWLFFSSFQLISRFSLLYLNKVLHNTYIFLFN